MTSRKADRLNQLASDLMCVKCQTRPRLGNIPRCRECLRVDTERELAARPRLLAGGGNRKPPVASRAAARKTPSVAPTVPVASKALTVAARPALPGVVKPVAAEPMREFGRPYSLAEWQGLITQTLRRWRAAGTLVQNDMAEESLAAKTIRENVVTGRVTYSSSPLVTLRPQSNAAASLLHWALARVGVQFDLVDVHGDISDSRTVCKFCDTKVKRRPCTESQSRSCRNRSRN
jgi:hypothetical protein